MKKFLIALSIILLLVSLYFGYKLKQANVNLLTPLTSDSETISQLGNEGNSKTEELSDLQSENQLLKDALSGAMESLNFLKAEKSELEKQLSGCENRVEKYVEYIKELREANNSNVGNNTTNTTSTTNTSNNNSSNSNTSINGKEVGKITQVYTDGNGNKKIEIIYGGGMVGGDECGDPVIAVCYLNEDPKSGTFIVSNNAKIIMQTLSHTSEGYFNNGQVITFDYFKQKFNDTNNYDEYPHNYSNHFKQLVYSITIENGIVTEIEEQYMP